MFKKSLRKDGYVICESDVDAAGLKEFRKAASTLLDHVGVKKHDGVRLPYAFKVAPAAINVFDIFRDLKDQVSLALGCDDWVLTGHCDLHKNALSGWHRDDGSSYGDGGYFGVSPLDYNTVDLGVFKVAVYLQEHESFEDVLTLEPGSHLRDTQDITLAQYIPSKLGQVVIFDQRLFHTGQITRIPKALTRKGRSVLSKVPDITIDHNDFVVKYSSRSEESFRSLRGDRMSVFFTVRRNYENEKHPAVIFERNNMKRQIMELASTARATFTPSKKVTSVMRERAALRGLSYSKYCDLES